MTKAALERLHGQAARDAQEIAYLRRALADLRGCVVAYLDATERERDTSLWLPPTDLFAALRRSAAVLRGERGVDFPGGHAA